MDGIHQDADALRRGVLADAVAEVEDVTVAPRFACNLPEAGQYAGDFAADCIGSREQGGGIELPCKAMPGPTRLRAAPR